MHGSNLSTRRWCHFKRTCKLVAATVEEDKPSRKDSPACTRGHTDDGALQAAIINVLAALAGIIGVNGTACPSTRTGWGGGICSQLMHRNDAHKAGDVVRQFIVEIDLYRIGMVAEGEVGFGAAVGRGRSRLNRHCERHK